MDKEKEREMIESLADFVIRVANGKATSETEVEVLSEVARVVVAYLFSSF